MLRTDPAPRPTSTAQWPAIDLLADKAWEYLGITGEEFRRRWYAREYVTDSRPEVLALDQLMRTGIWDPRATTPQPARDGGLA